MAQILDFEKPIAELESKIEELRNLSGADAFEGAVNGTELDIAGEVGRLQVKVDRLIRSTYAKLSAAQKVQVARHQDRPHCLDFINGLITDFTPLAGDRAFGEDEAMIGGIGRFRGHSVVVIGTEKGSTIESRLRHNFGMAKPEGYRKAQRLMRLADRFHLPVITLVDTAGAHPGAEAEARGQSEAIARSIDTCLDIRVPLIAAIIGEGGSGGAIALAAANTIMMMEHAYYSVISPEACASILWRSSDNAKEAAETLRLTAQDLLRLGVIDAIIDEPVGGAHRAPQQAIAALGRGLDRALHELMPLEGGVLRARRREKFLAMGQRGLG